VSDKIAIISAIGALAGAALSVFTAIFNSRTEKEQENNIRHRLHELANEYNKVRERMQSGSERTEVLENVADRLRALAPVSGDTLRELTLSANPGERLAAAVLLQVKPEPAYWQWLSERFLTEPPFVGYHAALALLSAVGRGEARNSAGLREAIGRGLASVPADTDRYSVLQAAAEQIGMESRRRTYLPSLPNTR
jgi:hypothetical protein